MAQITLTYNCKIGLQPPAAMAVKVGAVDLFSTESLDLLGMSVAADNTVVVGPEVSREIVLDVLPEGEFLFPTDEAKKVATQNLFNAAIAAGALVDVTALDPVVT